MLQLFLLIFIRGERRFLVSVREGERVVVDIRSTQMGLTLF